MNLKNVSSKPLIILILLSLSAAAILLSVLASYEAKDAAMSAQTKTMVRVLQVAYDEAFNKLHIDAVDVAQGAQKNKVVRKLTKQLKKGAISTAELSTLSQELNDQFNQRYVTTGIIDLVAVRAYDTKLNFIAESSQGEHAFPKSLPEPLREKTEGRSKAEQKKPVGVVWGDQQAAYYSVLVPIGTFRVTGFLETTVNLAHNLQGIGELLSVPIQIQTLDRETQFQSEQWLTGQESALEVEFSPKGIKGEPLLYLTLQEDVTEFLNSLKDTQFQIISLFIALGVVGVVLALLLLNYNLFLPMRRLKDAMSALTEGDEAVEIDKINRKDELGMMTNALIFFVHMFQENRRISLEASRIKVALQNSATGMLMLDEHEKIIFLNDQLTKLFQDQKQNIEQVFLGLDLDNIMGIDFGERFTAIRSEELQELSEPESKIVDAGSRHLKLILAPVTSESGERVGSVIEWHDLTEQMIEQKLKEENIAKELKVAGENSRIRQSLDGVATGVSILGEKGELVYFNESFQNMTHLIPGLSIQLHESFTLFELSNKPELVQQMQAGFSQQEIDVKDSVLLVTATPVINDEGKTLGTTLEWSDKTDEALVEFEIDNVISCASLGQLEARLDLANKNGFFLSVSQKLNGFLDTVSSTITEVNGVFLQMSQGDLTQRVTGEYQGDFDMLKQSVNKTATDLSKVITDIQKVADIVVMASQEISAGNQDLSNRTELQATTLEKTSRSIIEMGESSKDCASEADTASSSVNEAMALSEEGNQVADRAVSAMDSISESSLKVMEIIEVINGISFQTNLLALNAAVEAARAGDHGRGFAVVASEVGSLAKRSAASASEIKDLLVHANTLVEEGTKEVHDTGDRLKTITQTFTEITRGMQVIKEATTTQSVGINEASVSIRTMDDMTQQNAAMVEEIAATSKSTLDQANNMKKATSYFKV